MAGARRSPFRGYVNLLFTMLVGGLWHSAGWNFVLWGGVHGLMIAINRYFSNSALLQSRIPRAAGIATTSYASCWPGYYSGPRPLEAAVVMYRSLLGLGGIESVTSISWHPVPHLTAIALIVFCLPNTSEFMGRYDPGLNFELRVRARGQKSITVCQKLLARCH